jgi:hypothetical protein
VPSSAPSARQSSLIDSSTFPSVDPPGELRGRNGWEHKPGLLGVGAENVSIGAAEAIARAFMATDPVPFVSMDEPAPKGWRYANRWPYRATRMRRFEGDRLSPVAVPVHPDPRVQAVLEVIREDGSSRRSTGRGRSGTTATTCC